MKFLRFLAVLSFLSASQLYGETWIAICKDGKNIQYNQTKDGTGYLYMKVKDADNKISTYQIARLEQNFYNGIAICGSVLENSKGNDGNPITQICMNKSRQTIYVKYDHPSNDEEPIKSGVFCDATVWVN